MEMSQILIQSGCFICVILMGTFLRKIGFFQERDFRLLANIALPSPVISFAQVIANANAFVAMPAIVVFSPVTSAALPFTAELKSDTGLSSVMNSISIIISIMCMIAVILFVL